MNGIIDGLRERMQRLLASLEQEKDSGEKLQVVGRVANQHREGNASEPWVLEEWRRASIPGWRRILQESIQVGDKKRESDAREMLRDVLFDPDYEETEG